MYNVDEEEKNLTSPNIYSSNCSTKVIHVQLTRSLLFVRLHVYCISTKVKDFWERILLAVWSCFHWDFWIYWLVQQKKEKTVHLGRERRLTKAEKIAACSNLPIWLQWKKKKCQKKRKCQKISWRSCLRMEIISGFNWKPYKCEADKLDRRSRWR